MSEDRSTLTSGGGANGAPLVEQAKQQAGQVVQQTKQAASRVADQAVQQVKTQVETGKERTAGNLEDVAQALYATGETLRARNQEAIGSVTETGAVWVDQVSDYFRERSVDQIAQDIEVFARRQPGLFLGSAFAVGFMLSRFMKSSSPSTGSSGAYGGSGAMEYRPTAGATRPIPAPYDREVRAPSAGMPASPAIPTPSPTPQAAPAGATVIVSSPPSVAPAGKSGPPSDTETNKGVR